MNLAHHPRAYDPREQALVRKALAEADEENLKKRRDVRLENGERLILKDTATGALYQVCVTSGALTLVAL